MDRRRRRIKRKPVQVREIQPILRALETGQRHFHAFGEIPGRLRDESLAIRDAERARSGNFLSTKPPLQNRRLGLPFRERASGQKNDADRIGGRDKLREPAEQCLRALRLLLGIVENEEKALERLAPHYEVARGIEKSGEPALVFQNLGRRSRQSRLAYAALPGDEPRERPVGVRTRPSQNGLQLALAPVKGFHQPEIPMQQAE